MTISSGAIIAAVALAAVLVLAAGGVWVGVREKRQRRTEKIT